MQKSLVSLFLLVVLLLFITQSFPATYIYSSVDKEKDPIDQALSAIHQSRETCVFPLSGAAVATDKKWESPVYRSNLYRPFEIPYYAAHLEYNYDCYRDNLLRTMIFMAYRSGASLSRGYFSIPLAKLESRLQKAQNPLSAAMQELYTVHDITLTTSQLQLILSEFTQVPMDVQYEAARLLMTSVQAVYWQKKALRAVKKSDFDFLLQEIPKRLSPPLYDPDDPPAITEQWEQELHKDLRPLLNYIDINYLYCGAFDLMTAIEKTRENLSEKKIDAKFHAEWQTPLGFIVLNGSGINNLYEDDKHYLLIMDFGGSDTYHAGAGNLSHEKPVSLLLDFDGNDTYIQTQTGLQPNFGSGVLGYGFLLDFRGDDRYISPQLTLGCGYFGVGWLIDFMGNDTYESIRYAQGFAHFGLGFLNDRDGNDVYYSYNSSQGCGETRGCGMLVDEQGHDEYIANDKDIRFPSAQSAEHNRSICQGVGIGLRADEKDGHSLPGGVGILIDKKGDDQYDAGVFAQGVGYWSGVGLLIDSEGNDCYRGAWYVQAAGVHGGIAALCDRDGNDSYTATLHASQGMAHDNSIAVFLDEKGNDLYQSPRLSLGTGNQNSLGFFYELEGDDHYKASSKEALGLGQFSKWGTLREDRINVGMFIDASGNDRYDIPHGRNNQVWIQAPSKGFSLKSELGVGLDGDFEEINLRLRPLTEKPPNVEW